MRSVSLRLVDLERKPLIPLGFEGENEYMTINFDCKTVFDKHPAAVPTLAVTPPHGDSYPAVVVRDGDIVSWTVTDSDLVYPGEGELQLTFVDGTIIGKTYKARTKVLDSITPSGEAPTPVQNWLVQAAAALQALPTEVASSVVALMGAMVGVGETLDPDDDVTVNYDPDNNTLTIGVPHGRDGVDGHTPAIAAEKVGKVATFYVDGVAIVQISDGQDADPTALIDDTSTAQNRTWSAKKLDEEKQSLKTEINSLTPQFDVFNLYDKTNNVTGKYIDNNGAIQTSGTGGTYAVVPVENGKTYTICRIGYQNYESGKMLVVKSDKSTVLATVGLNYCTSVNYGEYIAKKYTVEDELAAYILFNVKLGVGDSIDSTIVTERDINGTQATTLTHLYDCQIPTMTDLQEVDGRIDEIEAVEGQNNRVSLLITEGKFQVRSAWDNTNDIAVTGQLFGSSNGAMTFDKLVTIGKSSPKDTYGGTQLSYIGDDIAPIKLKNTYIGGNHGYPASYTLTTDSNHGITTADIGKSFTDADSNAYVILAVPTSKTIYVCSTYTGDLDAPLIATAPTSPAIINGNSVTFTASAVQQLRPAINNVSVRVIVDGEREIDTSVVGVYDGSFVDISEEYTVVNIGEMLAYIADNIGENDNNSYHSDAISGYCKVTNRYRFTERGAVTLYYNLVWYTENEIEYIGAIQTAAVGGSYISVPGTEHGEIYNMGSTTTNFGTSTWNNSDKPPRAFYDFSDSSMSTGMVVGYHNIGSGNDDVRKDTISNACQYYGSTHKLYPRIYAKASEPVVVGQLITAIAYRTPSYTSSGNPFVSWYYVDGIPYVMVNVQSNYTGYIKLPDYFCGKIAEIVETDGSFDLITPFANTDGLYIDVSSYGFAVIRLAEKSKVSIQGGDVTDVQLNGTSILSDGVANIPIAGESTLGVMKVGTGAGGVEMSSGEIKTSAASEVFIKGGTNAYRPLVPYNQHISVFYGLAKLAGVDLKNSSTPVGTFPPEAQAAIKQMLGIT